MFKKLIQAISTHLKNTTGIELKVVPSENLPACELLDFTEEAREYLKEGGPGVREFEINVNYIDKFTTDQEFFAISEKAQSIIDNISQSEDSLKAIDQSISVNIVFESSKIEFFFAEESAENFASWTITFKAEVV